MKTTVVTINVTAEHIAHGKRSCELCPVALAIIELVREDFAVQVSARSVRIERAVSGDIQTIRFTRDVDGWIENFDMSDINELRWHKPEPFSFDIAIRTDFLKAVRG